MGFNVTQVYGLTETYGPVTECLWQPEWDDAAGDERAALKARTGVAMAMHGGDQRASTTSGQPVARDGAALGEIAHSRQSGDEGLLQATPRPRAEAFAGGWFHSGDIAFQHPDGYIKITDRAKDIIISGGENVSSVEVEGALMHHPARQPVRRGGQARREMGRGALRLCRTESRGSGHRGRADRLCRARLAGFKTPKQVVFAELPKTSTGKIQKFELRARAPGRF